MKSKLGAGIIGALLALPIASCSHSSTTPEAFCQGWVSSTCAALATCCTGGTRYDTDECQVSLSRECQAALSIDMVQSGERIFDSGAAATCFGTVSECTIGGPSEANPTYALATACANMVSGYVPLGAACSSADECQRSGDASTCYTAGNGGGVCATVVRGSSTCSFSFATNQFTVCPDGSYCDRTGVMPDPKATPEQQAFEFSAPCKPLLTLGAPCASAIAESATCGPNLFCDVLSPMPVCDAVKTAGQTCTDNDCAAGLECLPNAATGATCQQSSSFCYSACGLAGEACCASGTPCVGGTCQAGVCVVSSTCGAIGEPCCSGLSCTSGTCQSGLCQPVAGCGAIGEACCNGGSCTSGTCQGGICEASACGEIGEACCNGVSCNSGTCQSGVCEAAVDCTCACVDLMSAGGCGDLCSDELNGTTTPNFCEGLAPLSQCAACIANNCPGMSTAAGTCSGL